jgi:hypothetical protein
VGGPGEELVVDGVRFEAGPRSKLNPSELHYGEVPGAWRIEERPAEARAEDHFANVMLLGPRASEERPRVEILTNDGATLALRVLHEPDTSVTLRFAKGARASASMRIERGGRVVFDGALPDVVAP